MSEQDRTNRAVANRLREIAQNLRDKAGERHLTQYDENPALMDDQRVRGTLETADMLNEAADLNDDTDPEGTDTP